MREVYRRRLVVPHKLLRKDQARLENSQVQLLTESLRKHGIDDGVISAAIAEAQLKSA